MTEDFIFDRGYTGHEHLDAFGLINMNGRVYDPYIGRFLSPDPLVQQPGNLQNYNRYSYVLNNPLKYTDPSGYSYGHDFNRDRLEEAHGGGGTWINPYMFNSPQRDFNVGYEAMPGVYNYSEYTGTYTNSNGNTIGYQEVFNNYVVPNAVFLPTNTNLSSIEFGTHNGESGVWFSTITWGPLKRMKGEAFVVNTEAQISLSFLSLSGQGDNSNGVGEAGGSDGWVFGQSIDITIATPGGGYNIEGGWFLGDNGKQGSQFVSHGVAYGVEASAGWNFIFINPKSNFKFNDLEGMGASGTLNIGLFSISIFGNCTPGYPENFVFDSYKGFKIGIGPSFDVVSGSILPNSNTTFQNWIPESFKNINWLDLHWH